MFTFHVALNNLFLIHESHKYVELKRLNESLITFKPIDLKLLEDS